DATGKAIWSKTTIVSTGGEGFRALTSNCVAIASGCTSHDANGACVQPGLWGVDPGNGRTLWHLDGRRIVSTVADGFALISEPFDDAAPVAAWMMIDLATGKQVNASQRWTGAATFETQCCGGDEYVNVHVDGAILFAAHGDHVSVWYPSQQSIPTVTVVLP
ncbi:MAG: hypothetical protein JWR83_592, partial [Aeromicrobium sp.]|nr:hypothetical protein [Aeromicrobium sp.]